MTRCFACDPALLDEPETPPRFRPLLEVCAKHRSEVRLPSGDSLAEVVRRSSTPLEGPGLGFLLNPLTLAETRCWSTWAVGSWAAHPQIFPSGSYFEFEVQHRPEHVEVLYRLQQRRAALFSDGVTMRGVLAYIKAEGTAAAADTLQRLLGLWTRQQAYDRLLSRMGRLWARDGGEAQGMMLEVEPVQPDMDRLPQCVQSLLALSDRRFSRSPV